ncbi:MAG: hypothetical protein C0497_12995 [Gemmatimonas sp.]|nr:hypothetical protein [Gemmatimonas sp.]
MHSLMPQRVTPPAAAGPPWTRWDVAVIVAVTAVAAALVWPSLFHGWYPWDDGAMAQVAERVMRGQLPHRDFDEPWTGGWSFVQAGIFQLFGTSLRMLRIPIFLAWLGSLACGYRLTRRFTTPAVAGAATLAWAIWSLYAWRYPLLNWYYAPLALTAAWTIARFLETGHRAYVALAGALCGIAISLKITGLFLLAALLLWCAAHVASDARRNPSTMRGNGFFVFVAVAGTLFALIVTRLVLGLPREFHGSALGVFLLPIAGTIAWLVWEARRSGLPTAAGMRALAGLLVPLAAGLAVPLVPFLLVFVLQGAVDDLMIGVFVRPAARLSLVFSPPPGRLASYGFALAPLVLAVGVRYAVTALPRTTAAAAVLLGGLAGALAHLDQFTVASSAMVVRGLPLILPIVLLWSAWRHEEDSRPHGSLVFLLVATAATSQLLQVPWASLSYALYATPIAVIALVAVLGMRSETPAPAVLLVALFMVMAGLGHRATSEIKPEPDRWARLALPRGGLWVSPRDSALFDDVARLVAAQPAGPIHVVGDAPEYAFLLSRPAATRVIYDALADSAARDPLVVLPALDRAGVRTVLLLNQFGYNDSLIMRQQRALRAAYPDVRFLGPVVRVGPAFSRFLEVRWRPDAPR